MTRSIAAPDDQHEVIAFLSDSASYGVQGDVVRIDTHCSIVFLVADRAYKLKRAIRYASLDYTTRELRQAACEAELLLNRRTAPDLYLGVHSIKRSPSGALGFDVAGAALDHVVVMHQFAQSDLFDRMAQTERLTPALTRALGEAVAHLHLAAERTPRRGGSEAIRRVIADNDRELAKVAAELDGAAVRALSSRARGEADRLAALLEKRRDEGSVRRCHGDLRLANICLYGGRPTLFDSIEFSDEISCIDVLYDLAFLLMDLELRGRSDLGNAVFNAYLDLAPETYGLRALPLFLALRAATRSYALAGSAGRRADPQEAAQLLTSARRHIAAGVAFLAPQRPQLIVLGGAPDLERTELAAAVAGHVHPAPGARVLHPASSDQSPWAVASATLSAGCSVLVEGVFADAVDRVAVGELASGLGVTLLPFWVGTLPANLDARLWHQLDAGQGTLALLEQLLSSWVS